jgi:hypothetical protein
LFSLQVLLWFTNEILDFCDGLSLPPPPPPPIPQYYLADHKISIKEIRPRNSGQDLTCELIKRSLLPKVMDGDSRLEPGAVVFTRYFSVELTSFIPYALSFHTNTRATTHSRTALWSFKTLFLHGLTLWQFRQCLLPKITNHWLRCIH